MFTLLQIKYTYIHISYGKSTRDGNYLQHSINEMLLLFSHSFPL